MSQDIIHELDFLFHSFLIGVIITFAYDWLLIFRAVVKHSFVSISLEDIFYWICCAISIFAMLNKENNGMLRWFAVGGAGLGMLIYKRLIGKYFVGIMSTGIRKLLRGIKRILTFILIPIKWLGAKLNAGRKQLGSTGKNFTRYLKKQLTVCIKLLRMVLCKH